VLRTRWPRSPPAWTGGTRTGARPCAGVPGGLESDPWSVASLLHALHAAFSHCTSPAALLLARCGEAATAAIMAGRAYREEDADRTAPQSVTFARLLPI